MITYAWTPDGMSDEYTDDYGHVYVPAEVAQGLLEALEASLRWIDAVPECVPLPAMPGFDRDEVDSLIARTKGEGPIVTPDNHALYDVDTLEFPSFTPQFREALRAHETVNDFLDQELGKRFDWGAEYNAWLTRKGITPNSDNGWWSVEAVSLDNIRSFIKKRRAAIKAAIKGTEGR